MMGKKKKVAWTPWLLYYVGRALELFGLILVTWAMVMFFGTSEMRPMLAVTGAGGAFFGLGWLLAGLAIFIPVMILIALAPALAPVILLGLLIWWLVRRNKNAAPAVNARTEPAMGTPPSSAGTASSGAKPPSPGNEPPAG